MSLIDGELFRKKFFALDIEFRPSQIDAVFDCLGDSEIVESSVSCENASEITRKTNASGDLISRQKAIEELEWFCATKALKDQNHPSAERVGHWYNKNEGIWNVGMVMACSNCGESFYEMPIIYGEPTYNYCPNCGARMVSEDAE